MAQRLTRAKRKISQAQIPYRVPGPDELPDRLPAVLSVIYVAFTEAYAASRGPALVRPHSRRKRSGWLGSCSASCRDEREVSGLLALMLLVDARRAARVDADGDLVVLADQDRSLWDATAIEEGSALVERALRGGDPGPYGVQAAIAALHDQAASAATTDWPQIVALYGVLQESPRRPWSR